MPDSVRLAQAGDAEAIAAVQVAAWTAFYGSLLAGQGEASIDPAVICATWLDAIANPPTPRHRVLVATDVGGSVVGFAAIGPAEDPDQLEDVGQIHVLAVAPDHLGQGHGSRLMAACVDLMRQDGSTSSVTWVLLDDEPVRRFWQSAGWGPDSARRTHGTEQGPTGGLITEIRLVTILR